MGYVSRSMQENEYWLGVFLKRTAKREGKIRELSPEEFGMLMEIRATVKDMTFIRTQIIFITQVIRSREIRELDWIVQNFFRITGSLKKQQELLKAMSASFSRVKPDDREMGGIRQAIRHAKERIAFLDNTVIPENITLTPIKDYVDIIGLDGYRNELRAWFPTSKALFDSQFDESMDKYIAHVFDTLAQTGSKETYRERLDHYIRIAEERKARDKAEKDAERLALALSESENGMSLFRDLFFKGIRNLETIDKIGLSKQAIHQHMAQGHRGKFCVLCCGYYQGHLSFRYMTKGGDRNPTFAGCGIYETFPDAVQAIKGFQTAYPDKVFEAVAI